MMYVEDYHDVVLYCTYSTYVPYSLSPYRVLNSDTASAAIAYGTISGCKRTRKSSGYCYIYGNGKRSSFNRSKEIGRASCRERV